MINDCEEDEATPWNIGYVGQLTETSVQRSDKRMTFIGFYENKEKNMPYMTNGKRDYKKEDAWDANHPGRAADRNERHKARAMTDKAGLTHKGDGKDVDHKQALSKGGKTTKANLQVVAAGPNRSFSRNSDGSMKSQTSARERKRGK